MMERTRSCREKHNNENRGACQMTIEFVGVIINRGSNMQFALVKNGFLRRLTICGHCRFTIN